MTTRTPLRVAITGAAGQIGYQLAFRIASGQLFGPDRAVVLITHRLANVRHADRIYVLREGSLVEQGDHDTLVAQGGRYALLVQSGFAL